MKNSYRRPTTFNIFSLLIALSLTTTLMAQTVTWDGGGEDSNWSNENNWNPVGVPTSASDVVIYLDGATVTIPNDIEFAVNSLIIGDGTGSITTLQSASASNTVGFRLTVLSTVTIFSDGHLNMQGSLEGTNKFGDSLKVASTITNWGTITLQHNSHISTTALTNNGTLACDGAYYSYGLNKIVGNVTNSATGEIQIEGNNTSRQGYLEIQGDLTNSGLVYLYTTASSSGGIFAKLNVSGTFTNALTGTFVDSATTWDSIRSLTVGSFDNQGTFISRSDPNTYKFLITTESVAGTFTNSGHMDIKETMSIWNVDTFTNTGTITIDTTKTLTLYGFNNAGTYTGTGDQFHGNGTLSLTDIALNITSFPALDSLGLIMNGTSSMTLTDSLIVYRSITGGIITANGTRNEGTFSPNELNSDLINNSLFVLSSGTINGNVTNYDSLNVTSTSATINGTLTNMAGAGFRLYKLTMNGDITNHGYTALVPDGALVSSTGNQFINSASGTIEGETGYDGSSGHSYSFGANLVNAGTFESNFGVVFNGGDYSNSGTIRINQGPAGGWQSYNSTITFQLGATFTNTGTVFIDTTAKLDILGATYDGKTGTLDGTGTLRILITGSGLRSTGYLGQKFVMKDVGPKLYLSSATIHVDSLIIQTDWTTNGDTVFAGDVIINQGNMSLKSYSSLPYSPSAMIGQFINEGTLIAERSTGNLSGPVVNEAGAVISVISNATGTATMKIDSSLTNHGTLELLNGDGGTFAAYLDVNKGWLTNTATGVIDALIYGSITAILDNQGIFNVAPTTNFTIDKNPGKIINSGAINITAGNYFKAMYLDSLVNTGTITVAAGRELQLQGASTSGFFPSPESVFIIEGDGIVSNSGHLDIRYMSVIPGAKLEIGIGERVTLYNSQMVTDSLINEGYLTIQSASITGEVVNKDTIEVGLYGASFNSNLVNENGAHILGNGSYGSQWSNLYVSNTFINHGELELTTTGTSSKGINLTAGSLVNSNTGTIKAAVGLSTSTSLEHKINAEFANQGLLVIDSDAVLAVIGTAFDNEATGIIEGEGTLDAANTVFTNAGTIAPGGSPGILTVDGDLTFESTSVIDIEIEGDNPGTGYDQLNITGNAALAGSLKVILSYNPADGKTFLPLIYGSSSGVFESLTTQGGGKFLSAHITDTGLYLTASISGGNSWPFIGRIADITVEEDSTLEITLVAFDPDGNLGLEFTPISDTLAVVLTIEEDTLTITPELNWNGTANLKVVVADLAGLTDTTAFALTLTPVQDAPLAFDLTAPAKDSTLTITTNNLNSQFWLQWDWAVDPDGDNVTYDVVFTDSLELMPAKFIGANRSVSWTLSEIKTVMESNSYATMSGTWTVLARDRQDTTYATNGPFNLTFVNGTLGIDGGEGLPTAFALHQNYPNPFNPSTTVKFDVPETTELTVVVYDLLGRKVVTLVEGAVQPGYHRVIWSGKAADGSDVPTGIYIARLLTTGYTKSIKMLLLK